MKYRRRHRVYQGAQSPPARGAWIEIAYYGCAVAIVLESPPARGAWIEMLCTACSHPYPQSPPARGAWIEISAIVQKREPGSLSPPARGAWIEIRREPG